MKLFLSFLLSIVFLLQSFVTVQAMPIREGKVKVPCIGLQKVSKKDTCCSLLTKENKEQKEDKGCCSGDTKMSCCVSIIAIVPKLQDVEFISLIFQKDKIYGYLESNSSFEFDVFHPPILI